LYKKDTISTSSKAYSYHSLTTTLS